MRVREWQRKGKQKAGVAECAKGNWEEGKKRAGHRMQGMQGEYRGNSKTNTKEGRPVESVERG